MRDGTRLPVLMQVDYGDSVWHTVREDRCTARVQDGELWAQLDAAMVHKVTSPCRVRAMIDIGPLLGLKPTLIQVGRQIGYYHVEIDGSVTVPAFHSPIHFEQPSQ
jgi:hypothetical protein